MTVLPIDSDITVFFSPDWEDAGRQAKHPLVFPRQTHTSNVVLVETGSEDLTDTDAIVTLNHNLALGIKTADCVPILLYAPDIRGIAAVHAGWRGTLSGIAGKTIAMLAELGADPRLMKGIVGPCISAANYETGDDLALLFAENGLEQCVAHGYGKPHIDLTHANTTLMKRHGMQAENITDTGICTYDSELFPSWRKQPGTVRRLASVIEMK